MLPFINSLGKCEIIGEFILKQNMEVVNMQIGDKISFGNYEWRVLDRQNDTALIITDKIIEMSPCHDFYADITWAECSLRGYLNSKFYDTFTAIEKSQIITVMNKNPDNLWYGAKGGNNTKDRIFLLSLEDAVCRYFETAVQTCTIVVKTKNIGLNERMQTIANEVPDLMMVNGGTDSAHQVAQILRLHMLNVMVLSASKAITYK